MAKPIYFDKKFDVAHFLANIPKYIVLDTETSKGGTRREDIVTVGLVASNGPDEPRQKVCFHVDPYLPWTEQANAQLQQILDATLFNPSFPGQCIFHNADFDMPLLLSRYYNRAEASTFKFRTKNFCRVLDTAALSRTLDNRKYVFHADQLNRPCHGLKFLSEELLDEFYGDVVGKRNAREIPIMELVDYNIKDCDCTLDIFFHLRNQANACVVNKHSIHEKSVWDYFNEIEMPFVWNIVGLNWRGVGFDHLRAKEMADVVMTAIEREENAIAEGLGRRVNLQAKHSLISAIQQNPNLCVLREGYLRLISLPFETERGQQQVDIASFKFLRNGIKESDPASLRTRKTLNHLIRALELWQAYAHIEQLQKHAVKLADGTYRLFPRYTIDARTGRVKCGRPNLQALAGEMFGESEIGNSDFLLLRLKNDFETVRCLLTVANKETQEMISVDISGLDLGVIGIALMDYDPEAYWAQCFRRYNGFSPDTHYAILQRAFPEEFMQAFAAHANLLGSDWTSKKLLDFWVTKEIDGKINFIRRTDTNQVHSVPVASISKTAQKINKTIRSGGKTDNLAISYGQGPQQYALSLMEALGRPVTMAEAKARLGRFMDAFPELVEFKNEVMNSVYRDGYKDTPFGRRIFADIFTELIRYYQLARESGTADEYEFIISQKGSYFYAKVAGWQRASLPVVENMKVRRDRHLLAFRKVHTLYELDPTTFALKKNPDFSRRSRKSESNPTDQSKYEKTLFEITEEVDAFLYMGTAWEPAAEELRRLWDRDGLLVIPDKQVVFYRVKLPTPSAAFFHKFRNFASIARSQFAIHSQALAAIVAKQNFNLIQQELEALTDSAHIVLFPHDQYVTEGLKYEREIILDILTKSIAIDKPGLFPSNQGYGFTGEIEGPSSNFSLI